MDCTGTVERVEGKRAVVQVDRTNCGKCQACGLLSNNRQERIEYDVPNRLNAEPGDLVILRIASGKLFHAYLVVFGVPVVAMILGYLLGAYAVAPLIHTGPEGTGVVMTLLAGALTFVGCLRLANRMGLSPYMQSFAEEPADPPD